MADGLGEAQESSVTGYAAVDRLFAGGTVLCDGAMGTMLYARGVFINRCYDELNLSQPDLVREIHAEYLQAGAEVIETNTFGGNAYRLEEHGLKDKVREINLAGVRLARECVEQIREKQASEAFVAGSIGPLGVRLEPLGKVGLDEARAAFEEQIRALVDGGPGVGADLLIIETMTSLAESEQAIQAARNVAPDVPVIVMMTVDEEGNCLDGSSAETAAEKLTEWGADAIGCNCSAGPVTVLSVIERMKLVTAKPLAAMPNAGIPRAVDGRTIYLTSPEYMASFAKKAVKAGATFVGGCCGTTPSYTRAMKSSLRALDAMEGGVQVMEHAGADKAAAKAASKVEPPVLAERSKIGSMVAAGDFITMVEIVPPKGIDCSKEIDGAALLAQAWSRRDQCTRLTAGQCADERAEPVCADSAARGNRDNSALHLPRQKCAEYSKRSAGGVVDRAEEHSLPDGRSAEAGELSECNGGLRRGRDWVGERRPQLELWVGYRKQLNWRLNRVHDRGGRQPRRAGHGPGGPTVCIQGGGRR